MIPEIADRIKYKESLWEKLYPNLPKFIRKIVPYPKHRGSGIFRVKGYARRLQKKDRPYWIWETHIICSKEEAEFIIGTGISGCFIPLKKVVIIGKVNWSEEEISKALKEYPENIGRKLSIEK